VIFYAGLPRSGSTLLAAALSQDPKLAVHESCNLLELLNTVRAFYTDRNRNKASSSPDVVEVLKAIVSAYSEEGKTNIFKDRRWPLYLGYMELVDGDYKVICTVRHPMECLASFDRLMRKTPEYFTQVEDFTNNNSAFTSKAQYDSLLHITGSIGKAYAALYEASIVQQRTDRMLFVDYNKLCSNPEEQLARVYSFLEIPLTVKHNFSNLQNASEPDDKLRRMTDNLHVIEKRLRPSNTNLGRVQHYISCYEHFDEFWKKWT
jgi:sulfotransferase